MNDRAQRVTDPATPDGGGASHDHVSIRRFCLRTAKHLSNLHRERAKIFANDAALFHDPAWDILLNLYIAFCENRRPIKSEATMSDTFPKTTGLRILGNLQTRGLVKSERHPVNGRILLQSLTDRGVALMEACLQTMVEPRWRALPSEV